MAARLPTTRHRRRRAFDGMPGHRGSSIRMTVPGHDAAAPGASEIVSRAGSAPGSTMKDGHRRIRDPERRVGRAVDAHVHRRAIEPPSGPIAWTHSDTFGGDVGRQVDRHRAQSIRRIDDDLGPPRPGAAGRLVQVDGGRDGAAAGHDRQDASVGRPGLEAIFDDRPRRERPAAPARDVSADDRGADGSAAGVPAAVPDPQPERDDAEQEEAADDDGDDRPAERADHPARHAVAATPRGHQQEHREDAGSAAAGSVSRPR